MSNYNADIRIGVVGQSKLKTLQKDLDKVNASVTKLNKALVLKTRAQTIKLNTKGANTAIKQLEDRINKLGRTITVNVRTNEQKGSGGSKGGGGGVFVSNNAPAQQLAIAKASQPIAEALTNEAQDLLDAGNKRIRQIKRLETESDKYNTALKEQAKMFSDIRKLETAKGNQKAAQMFGKGTTTAEALAKQNKLLQEQTKWVEVTRKVRNAAKQDVVESSKAYQQLAGDANRAAKAELNAAQAATKQAAARKKFNRGFGAGAGTALASAAGNIPVLGDAATGGLVANFTGGSVAAGALAGAIVGLGVAAASYANQAAIAAAETSKFELALRGITSGIDYTTALEDIAKLSDQFIQDLGTTTQQFTKLAAATTANGVSISETTEVYKGLAAANLALGGNSERLQGILLATSQVFSKGKVQAEELRGQIGERLPGAFALFAKAVGKTPAELDKALEKGKVTVEDFVTFTKKLYEQYGEDAKIIAEAPENAGARLEKALGDLQRNVGTLLAPIGAAFQDVFTQIIKVIDLAAGALINFMGIGTDGAINKASNTITSELKKINNLEKEVASGIGGQGGSNRRATNALANAKGRLKAAQVELQVLQAKKRGTAEPPTKPVSATGGDTKTGGSGGSSTLR